MTTRTRILAGLLALACLAACAPLRFNPGSPALPVITDPFPPRPSQGVPR